MVLNALVDQCMKGKKTLSPTFATKHYPRVLIVAQRFSGQSFGLSNKKSLV